MDPMKLDNLNFWFVAGSQFLYGYEVPDTVDNRTQEMTDKLNASGILPCRVIYKLTAKTNTEISDIVREANHDVSCDGLITWGHTFSPSKMWINGLASIQKAWCHLAAQYNREIPDDIDMDFMNLNKAAQSNREHGFTGARLRIPRKVIAGYWQDKNVIERMGRWIKTAADANFSRSLKVMRFGGNMNEAAVTEGDKVEVQAELGWQVNTLPVGVLAEEIKRVTAQEIETLMQTCRTLYDFNTNGIEGCIAFSNTFQNLYGMKQLKGRAAKHLLALSTGLSQMRQHHTLLSHETPEHDIVMADTAGKLRN